MKVKIATFLLLIGASSVASASTVYSYSGLSTETDYACELKLEVDDSDELIRYRIKGSQVIDSPLSSRIVKEDSWASNPHLDRGEYTLPLQRSLFGNEIYYADRIGGLLGYEKFKLSLKGDSFEALESLKYVEKLKLAGATLDTVTMDCYGLELEYIRNISNK